MKYYKNLPEFKFCNNENHSKGVSSSFKRSLAIWKKKKYINTRKKGDKIGLAPKNEKCENIISTHALQSNEMVFHKTKTYMHFNCTNNYFFKFARVAIVKYILNITY